MNLRHSVLCKNKCGYYGNPSWDNYCSRCYRESQNKADLYARKARALSQTSSRAFASFEAKRKKVAEKSSGTIKTILKIQKDQLRTASDVPEESMQARAEFYKTLKSWRPPVEADVSKQIEKLLKNLDFSDISKFSESVKDFYEFMARRVYSDHIYQYGSTEQKEGLLNAIERFLSVWLYPWAFAPSNTDDEEIDLKLQDRIRSFHWISHKHLDAPIDPYSPQQSRHLEDAILHLIRQNEVLPTEAKLDQIVDCCREIMKALKLNAEAARSPASVASNQQHQGHDEAVPSQIYDEPAADAFIPSLIWIVLRANPPLLHSNLQFITRFANENRVRAGEPACFFAHLCGAVEFIKHLNHESLGMTEDEFEEQMRNGIPVTLLPADASDALVENKRRYAAIGQKLEDMEAVMMTAEIELSANQRQTADFVAQLRNKCNLQRTVFLDPRELTTPNILCLGPPPPPARANRSVPPQPLQQPVNVIDQLRPDESLAASPCLSPLSATMTPPPPPPR
ncbi:hypothetical protein Aperf_G00000038733 [Anoplocephala perfoliata]